ncbi:MAG: 3-oxoacyl-[acyl-carrier-protein] reductase [Candidatus Pacebacteria bacterium]|nr:3-oxoacyl-[acyl-carrier-protein] reductase [Candidatus Paceibacterota bacterium]
MKLNHKVAVITGGARGIGKAIGQTLAAEGAKLAVSDILADAAEATAAEFRENGTDAKAFTTDVADSADVQRLVKDVLAEFGQIDILVNNAGITRDNLLLRLKDTDWETVLAVNLTGTFNCIKAVARPMMKARSGKIINIASVVGVMGNAGQANYSASKGGVIALTKTAAKEFASRNINVNAVAPGYIITEMTERLPEEAREAFLKLIPFGRGGTPDDVARVVGFLASPDADYITGQTINVDGGMVM